MNEETQSLLATALTEISGAMRTAIAEHGQGAVDLALLAYQVEAIRHLMIGGLLVLPLILCVASFGRVLRFNATLDYEFKGVPFVAYGVVSLISAIAALAGISELISIVHWVAAFGAPELLIATKALQAAGIL